MAYIVDTQIFIWSIISPNKLPDQVKELLQSNQVFVCHISLFEIAIKQKIGKLPQLRLSIDELIHQATIDNFSFLPITASHISSYDTVPLIESHKDPFDRLIIATAIAENLPIISADEKFQLYKKMIALVEAWEFSRTSNTILNGVTRKSIVDIAHHWGVPVEERKVAVKEIIGALKEGRLEAAFGAERPLSCRRLALLATKA